MSIVGMRKFMQGRLQYIMLALAIIFAVGWIGICIGSGRFEEKEESFGGAIAKVNNEKLDWKTFEKDFRRALDEIQEQQGGRMLSALEESMIRGRIFDDKVDQILRVQAAKEEGIKVSRREIKAKINQVVEDEVNRRKEQILARYKGKKTDKAFDAELRQSYGTSLRELKSNLHRNIDPNAVRQGLIAAKLEEKLKNSVDRSDKALRESFDEVRFKQITVSTEMRPEAAAEQRAKELLGNLRKGANFATLAKQYSDDPYKTTGGDRGFFMQRSSMDSILRDVVFKLKPGEIGGPIKIPVGYVIVKLDARQGALPADFNDPKKKKEYRDAYLTQEQYRILREYPEKLRRKAKIEIYDSELRGFEILKGLSALGFLSPAGRKARFEAAIREYQKALQQVRGEPQATARIYTQIGYSYDQMRRPEFGLSSEEQVKYRAEAKKALRAAWEGSGSNDLDLLLADIYIEEGKIEKALEHLEIASQSAIDPGIHYQLMSMLEKLTGSGFPKVAELIAQERQWQADYERQMRERQGTFNQPPAIPAPKEEKPGG